MGLGFIRRRTFKLAADIRATMIQSLNRCQFRGKWVGVSTTTSTIEFMLRQLR